MKRCPECRRDYYDDSLLYCLDDGNELLEGPSSGSGSLDEPATAILSEPGAAATGFPASESPTRAQIHSTDQTAIYRTKAEAEPQESLGGLSEKHSFSTNRAAGPPSNRNKLLAISGFIALLLVAGFFGYRYLSSNNKQIESIAVMPFVNESGNADIEYLSDGMTETLISSLSQLPNLNVQARSSVFRYKGKDTDAKTIGKELNVQAILNGRIVSHGDDLVLYLELVDAQTGKLLWGDQYNRKQSDLVTLQSEIARDVSGKLKLRLSGADVAKVEKKSTASPEAYQLYLKGRFFWNKRTPESLKQAVDYFNQAVEKDPNYALAYSGLAEGYVLFTMYSIALPNDCMPQAKTSALRAIEIDDSLAETHTALGIYYSTFAWNQPAAEKEFRRAIELDPNYAGAHQQFAIECLTSLGRFDEAVAEGRRAVELDPLSLVIRADYAIILRIKRSDEAIQQLNRALELDPNFWVAHWYLGITYYGDGQYQQAVAEYRKALVSDNNPWIKATLIQALARAGKHNEAVELLGDLQADVTRRYVARSSLAIAYGSLGEKDKAFSLLEAAIADRSMRPGFLAANPVWNDLSGDPRFADIIRRIEAAKMD